MAKRLFILFLSLFFIMAGNPTTTYAYTDIIYVEGEEGYDSYIDVRLYPSKETVRTTLCVYFYNTDTKQKYAQRFNPYNYDEEDVIWAERVNLPNGRYEITGGAMGDIAGKYKVYTEDKYVTLDNNTESILCLLGSFDWIEEHKFTWEDVVPTPIPTTGAVITFAPEIINTPTPEPTVTEPPTETPTPTPFTFQESENPEPEEIELPFDLAALAGAIFVTIYIYIRCRKRKK